MSLHCSIITLVWKTSGHRHWQFQVISTLRCRCFADSQSMCMLVGVQSIMLRYHDARRYAMYLFCSLRTLQVGRFCKLFKATNIQTIPKIDCPTMLCIFFSSFSDKLFCQHLARQPKFSNILTAPILRDWNGAHIRLDILDSFIQNSPKETGTLATLTLRDRDWTHMCRHTTHVGLGSLFSGGRRTTLFHPVCTVPWIHHDYFASVELVTRATL